MSKSLPSTQRLNGCLFSLIKKWWKGVPWSRKTLYFSPPTNLFLGERGDLSDDIPVKFRRRKGCKKTVKLLGLVRRCVRRLEHLPSSSCGIKIGINFWDVEKNRLICELNIHGIRCAVFGVNSALYFTYKSYSLACFPSTTTLGLGKHHGNVLPSSLPAWLASFKHPLSPLSPIPRRAIGNYNLLVRVYLLKSYREPSNPGREEEEKKRKKGEKVEEEEKFLSIDLLCCWEDPSGPRWPARIRSSIDGLFLLLLLWRKEGNCQPHSCTVTRIPQNQNWEEKK